MKKLLLLLLAVLTFSTAALGQDEGPIRNDPNVKIGKLSNGMTYYIRANKKPEKRVELRLAVNAGSMQETDAQVGWLTLLSTWLSMVLKDIPEIP